MKSIRRSEVPTYLRTSDFYLSLDEEDDEVLEIPEINYKQTTTIVDENSLRNLLSTLLFWGVHEVLDDVYDAVVFRSELDEALLDFVEKLRYLEVLRKLRNVVTIDKKLTIAFADGNIQIAKYLIFKFSDAPLMQRLLGGLGKRLTQLAAGNGNLACLTFAHSLNCAWDREACNAAARNGHCNCLAYLHKNGCEWSEVAVVEAAAIYGHLDCLRYLVAEGCAVSSLTLKFIAMSDNVECLSFIYSRGVPWTDFGPSAASSNALKCLQFAFENGYKFEVGVMLQFRSTECLQLVHDNGFVWTTTCAGIVAASDKLELFRYLHQLGCPWNADTCVQCIHCGDNIDCLRYAIEQGCPCDERALLRASSKLNIVAMEFMYTSGCFDGGVPQTLPRHAEFEQWYRNIYNRAVKSGLA